MGEVKGILIGNYMKIEKVGKDRVYVSVVGRGVMDMIGNEGGIRWEKVLEFMLVFCVYIVFRGRGYREMMLEEMGCSRVEI